ncbi:MAG: TIGR04255 family protein [Pirellulales bacterium]|nr:TIGR04255 family protein [Pirellulales bacterium]
MPSGDVTYFAKAPIVERVLGVQFASAGPIHAGMLGAFWKTLGPEWKQLNEASPIEQQFEEFGKARTVRPALSVTLSKRPPLRLQFLNTEGNRLIQVQDGRFHFNWRDESGDDYPRFAQIKTEFFAHYDKFRTFLLIEAGVAIAPNQWEITYVNHIARDTLWQAPGEWPAVFRNQARPFGPMAIDGLELSDFEASWHYDIAPELGRLHIEFGHAFLQRDERLELLIINLTARGPLKPEPDEPADCDAVIERGLTLGREKICMAFEAITSPTAQQYWKRQNGDG